MFLAIWQVFLVHAVFFLIGAFLGLAELGLSSVDTVILSFPSCSQEDITLDKMKPVWKVKQIPSFCYWWF